MLSPIWGVGDMSVDATTAGTEQAVLEACKKAVKSDQHTPLEASEQIEDSGGGIQG
jgi:hypothetical protein